MLHELMDLVAEHAAEHEGRGLDSVPAKLDSLFKKTDPEIIGAELSQRLRDLDHAVAVPVRLDHPHDPDIRSDTLPDPVEIVPQAFQVDLSARQTHVRQKIYSFRS